MDRHMSRRLIISWLGSRLRSWTASPHNYVRTRHDVQPTRSLINYSTGRLILIIRNRDTGSG